MSKSARIANGGMRGGRGFIVEARMGSVIWSAARNWGQRLGTILTFFVLVRLVSLDEIGTFAAAAAVVALLELFADNGLGDAVVQSKSITSGAATAVLLINFAIAIILFSVVFFAAPVLGRLVATKSAEDILRVSAAILVLNSLSYVPQALMRKEFQFRRLAFRTFASTIIGAATGICMALLGLGVWSMVAQSIVGALINVVLAWCPLVLRISAPDFKGALPLVQFGAHIFVSRILSFSSLRLIEIVIPGFFGAAALGLYFMGSRLPAVLAQMISAVMVDVSLPHFSKLARDPESLSRSFYSNVEFSAALAAGAFLGLGALAPEVSVVAFGANGNGSDKLMLPLAILGAIQAIGFYNNVILSACGYPNVSMWLALVTAVSSALLFFAMKDTNVDVFIYGFVCMQILMSFVGFVVGERHTSIASKQLLRICAPFFFGGSVALALVMILRESLGVYLGGTLLRGSVLGVAFALTYALLLVLVAPKAITRVLNTILKRNIANLPAAASLN